MESPQLGPVPGDIVIDLPGARTAACTPGCAGAHSWTADARRVCWRGDPPGGAVDAECATAPVPAALAARWPLPREEFWAAWTRAEVHAKLHDVPILTWLIRHGLGGRGGDNVRIWTGRVQDLTITVGHRSWEGRR